MRSLNDLWEALGELGEDEVSPVLALLFAVYEKILAQNPHDDAALQFFQNLDTILSQVGNCNLNRR